MFYKYSRVFLLFFLLVTFLSCKKETTIIEPAPLRKLVIITDDEPGTDIMLTILGTVRSNYPDVETEFIQTKLFDIHQAAYLADIAIENYPAGTYFAIIVEPGAGSKRLICNIKGRYIIAPDNGVLSRAYFSAGITFPRANYIENASVLQGADWQNLPIEQFYSRSIISMLSANALENFGPECTPYTWEIQPPSITGDTLTGEILYTDNFGNCYTDITPSLMTRYSIGDTLTVSAGSSIFPIIYGTSYSSVPIGKNVCMFTSSYKLELAINYGNLSETYGIAAGTKVKMWK